MLLLLLCGQDRYADAGHVQNASTDTFPNDEVFGYVGSLCYTVPEICTDGKDNDGAQVCHTNTCPATLHEGLQGFWQFEETLLDNSENEQELSKVGSNDTTGVPNYTDYIRGSLGQAMWFDGINDSFRHPGSTGFYAPLNPDEAVTVTAWVSADDPTGVWEGVAAKQPDVFTLHVGDERVRFGVDTSSGSANVQSSGGSINAQQWHHITGTYNGSHVQVYVDGVQAASTTHTGNLTDTSGDFEVGHDNSEYFDGRIDQVRVYDRALSDSEIASFYNSTCNNRERTVECVNSPELCDTNYSSATAQNYHCNYGQYDDPQNPEYLNDPPSGEKGKGICCPRDEDASWDPINSEWECRPSDECGIGSSADCQYNITANESGWFDSRSNANGTNDNACNSQVPDLHEDDTETSLPEGSQACCYVPKDGKMGWWYKDGNVKIYG